MPIIQIWSKLGRRDQGTYKIGEYFKPRRCKRLWVPQQNSQGIGHTWQLSTQTKLSKTGSETKVLFSANTLS